VNNNNNNNNNNNKSNWRKLEIGIFIILYVIKYYIDKNEESDGHSV
jgi:hypothetical protein